MRFIESDYDFANSAVYLEVLLALVDMSAVQFNKRCASIAAASDGSKRSIITSINGTTHEADVVIGADGIKSAVRTAVVGDAFSSVVFTNTHAYCALVPLDDVVAVGVDRSLFARSRLFLGRDKVSYEDSKRARDFEYVYFAVPRYLPRP